MKRRLASKNGIARRDRPTRRREFGDFQTPELLARAVCELLGAERPASIVEPTCGIGGFLVAALDHFKTVRVARGFDINADHLAMARRVLQSTSTPANLELSQGDFFELDWGFELARFPEPILVLGNPPWVTNAALAVMNSTNHPEKKNDAALSGIDAVLGKSNFDVSEWIIRRLLDALQNRRATLAMLCKSSVAHKVVLRSWQDGCAARFSIHRIDAAAHFGVNVDACILIGRMGDAPSAACPVFESLTDAVPLRTMSVFEGHLIADWERFASVRHLFGGRHRWRSGLKHDCADVFELRRDGTGWRNGYGERVMIEDRYLYPLLKSSDIGGHQSTRRERKILLTQQRVGEKTDEIADLAPKTWRYLLSHAGRLDRRASLIYRAQPRFSIFGVGPYTFSKWKVAVSGLYKSRRFIAVGPSGKRPVIVDDTCYVLPCGSAAEARRRATLLNSDPAREFFDALVPPGAERPLTAGILNALNLDALEADAGVNGVGASVRQCDTRRRKAAPIEEGR